MCYFIRAPKTSNSANSAAFSLGSFVKVILRKRPEIFPAIFSMRILSVEVVFDWSITSFQLLSASNVSILYPKLASSGKASFTWAISTNRSKSTCHQFPSSVLAACQKEFGLPSLAKRGERPGASLLVRVGLSRPKLVAAALASSPVKLT